MDFVGEHCLLCFENIALVPSWQSFLIRSKKQFLCGRCKEKFEPLTGMLCKSCGRSLEALSAEQKEGELCFDCIRWEQGPFRGMLQLQRSLYGYNEWGKEVLARYKFRGDALLAQIFHEDIQRAYKQISPNCTVIPVPLSEERLLERGFNQAELISSCLPGVDTTLLKRIHTEKQSKKTRAERLQTQSPFLIEGEQHFNGKSILLVDDVYTTGTTLRQIGGLFHERGAAGVYGLTLFRG